MNEFKVGDNVTWSNINGIGTIIALNDGFAWIRNVHGIYATVSVGHLMHFTDESGTFDIRQTQ